MNTLIIEDDPAVRKILGKILSDFGEISYAKNGAEGVCIVNEQLSEGISFELICLDIMMPQMSGKEALKLIRDVESRHNVSPSQVFIISALSPDLASKEFPIDDNVVYIEKPFRKDDLVQKLSDFSLV